jgi:predicted alpha/beta hydrolase family esterase
MIIQKEILFVHSAGPQGPFEGSNGLVAYLKEALGNAYDIKNPMMPEPENPRYEHWKKKIKNEMEMIDGEVILIGHSLGGSVLLKYLSEEKFNKPIAGLFLIATAYWGVEDWEIDEYILQEDFAKKLPPIQKIFLYHSREDEWVPFEHLEYYAKELPQANARALEGNTHDFSVGLPEIIDDIRNLRVNLEMRMFG